METLGMVLFGIVLIWLISIEFRMGNNELFDKWLNSSMFEDRYVSKSNLLDYILRKNIVDYQKDSCKDSIKDYSERIQNLEETIKKLEE
ncbi:MAG TPA: hypothetical protein VI911_08600 [Patescibacteria group bacterium]|nr:MAG: hypothetical protein UR43_C0005G0113 [candidate division TM6 bacterium GW2011_GWF2_33_332]HLD91055.1 hypothetical protein [Patescibacteria group bacterium]